MEKKRNILVKVFSNPALLYIFSRYGTYFIQFVNSLFIAIYLGPLYLGVWGFIQLIILYFAQINLGIPHSINVIVSIEKKNEGYSQKIIGNGISMLIVLSILVILFFLINQLFGIGIGDKYSFGKYSLWVCIIAILSNFNNFFSNIFRIYGKIAAIAINQSLFPILMFIVILLFRGENLLWALVITNFLSVFISFLIFFIQRPVAFRPQFNAKTILFIQKKGWHLFIYNASFYIIILSTKTFISSFYSVKEFGFFTFSYSLANAILLLLNSISFLIYPKMLNRFAKSSNDEVMRILGTIRVAYISLSHFLIHAVIMLFPFFIHFFPQYLSVTDVFRATALTIVLYVNSFGYQGLLIARGKEKIMGNIALTALFLNILFCIVLVYYINVSFSMVIFATLLTYLIYVLVLSLIGRKCLGLKNSFNSVLKDIFPFSMMIPFFMSVVFVIAKLPALFFILPFIVFILFNHKLISNVKKIVGRIIRNPEFINI